MQVDQEMLFEIILVSLPQNNITWATTKLNYRRLTIWISSHSLMLVAKQSQTWSRASLQKKFERPSTSPMTLLPKRRIKSVVRTSGPRTVNIHNRTVLRALQFASLWSVRSYRLTSWACNASWFIWVIAYIRCSLFLLLQGYRLPSHLQMIILHRIGLLIRCFRSGVMAQGLHM